LERLKSIDPDYAEIVHINNKKRLVRALEIFEATGKPPSDHFSEQEKHPVDSLDLFTVLLNWNRDVLVERIAKRTDDMLESGWIDEVKDLIEKQKDGGVIFPALDSIGYRQIQSFLNDEMSYDDMREEIVIRTRQFSRRQMQWFKKENIDCVVEMDNLDLKKLPQIIFDLVSG
jgi:tRNA dimethylallyltransferase